MEHRGIKFEVVPGSLPDVWKWSVLIGNPPMLRIGEAATNQQVVAQVKQVIDRVLAIEASGQRQNDRSE